MISNYRNIIIETRPLHDPNSPSNIYILVSEDQAQQWVKNAKEVTLANTKLTIVITKGSSHNIIALPLFLVLIYHIWYVSIYGIITNSDLIFFFSVTAYSLTV